MAANAGGAVEVDMQVEQGSDWPGFRVPLFDKNNVAFNPIGCVAHGEIKLNKSDPDPIFVWSTSPSSSAVGTITLVPTGVIWTLEAHHTASWSFTQARYEIKLHNPAAPAGDKDMRVAQGSVLLDQQLDTTVLT